MLQLCNGQDAVTASLQSRQLLSQLSSGAGFYLEPASWSKRGTGRPRHPDMPAGWHASISHRQGRVVAALANCPIGIDLEFWQHRHTTRLNDLIELLPEPAIRQQIRQSGDPQRSFYKAYTLHEALYKLASANAQPVEGLFQTRIADIQPLGEFFAWQWEDPQWSLSIVASLDVSVELSVMEQPAIHSVGCPAPELTHQQNDGAHPDETDLINHEHHQQIALKVDRSFCYLSEQFAESPAIRPLRFRKARGVLNS